MQNGKHCRHWDTEQCESLSAILLRPPFGYLSSVFGVGWVYCILGEWSITLHRILGTLQCVKSRLNSLIIYNLVLWNECHLYALLLCWLGDTCHVTQWNLLKNKVKQSHYYIGIKNIISEYAFESVEMFNFKISVMTIIYQRLNLIMLEMVWQCGKIYLFPSTIQMTAQFRHWLLLRLNDVKTIFLQYGHHFCHK